MSALVVGAMKARSGVGFDSVRSSINGGGALLLAAVVALTAYVIAQPSAAAEPDQPQHGWREVWGGVDASSNVWLLYGGVTIAPWSADIYSNGWRLRTTGGFGQYRVSTSFHSNAPCGNPGQNQCQSADKDFVVPFTYSDALIGYHQRFGELTAKAFAGVAIQRHAAKGSAGLIELTGTEIGPKGVLELWLNLGSQAWTSIDLSYTTAHDTSSARWRAGWRALPTLSIGPEARFDRNADLGGCGPANGAVKRDALGTGRAGLFARYDWFGGEVSVAAGVTQRIANSCEDDDLEPYATFNLLYQY